MYEEQRLDAEERRRRLREIQLPDERKIIKHADFEIAWPERVTTVGFIIITILCILLILVTSWIGKLLI